MKTSCKWNTNRMMIQKALLVAVCAAGLSTGCSRQLTVKQHPVVNCAPEVHMGLESSRWNGEPLQVDIVCVNNEILSDDRNTLLESGSGINCRDWFDRRPLRDEDAQNKDMERFGIARKNIIVFADDKNTFGDVRKRALSGGKIDGSSIPVELDFPKGCSSIYVFAKFVGPNGEVLQVPPAVFASPKWSEDLAVEIGVDKSRYSSVYGQYIRGVD